MDQINRAYKRYIGIFLGIVVISLLVITTISGPVAAHTGDDGSHHHDGWMGTHGGMDGVMYDGVGFGWMLLWTIILISIPVALVYLLVTRREKTGRTDDDALAVLRRRYAEGEIDEEEFETRRAKLGDNQY